MNFYNTFLELKEAADALKRGEVIAFPTETVYGLGACLFNEQAIQKVFTLKGRPSDNPLITHIFSLEEVEKIALEIPKEFHVLATHFFPGPLTIILKKHPSVPSLACAGLDTIAFRMPSHSIALALLHEVGPLAAPSANLSGKPSPTCKEHVLQDFQGKIAGVLDGGECGVGIESTVLNLTDPLKPILLRPGIITKEELEKTLNLPIEIGHSHHSPGMKYRHYAPKAKVRLFKSMEEMEHFLTTAHPCSRMALSDRSLPFAIDQFLLTAQTLYKWFRLSDLRGDEEILILCDSPILRQPALLNRILKTQN